MNGRSIPQAARRALPLMVAALILGLGLPALPAAGSSAEAAQSTPGNFTELARTVSPAVVNIRTEKDMDGGGRVFRHFQSPFGGENDPFKDFFEKFFGEGPQRDFKQRSLGSGFIIDGDGYIVTNNHVIEDADRIKVKLNTGGEYEARIVGRDPNTDLALIQIEADETLPSLKLGDSDQLEVGQWVVAIGSPFGLEHTVTAGIVSAKGRVIGSGPYDDFIQTDASINPGNSGGPLLNMAGEVVGINTAIIASGQGIGFAVPVNMARNILEQLKQHGEVTRGWLGVAIQDLTAEIADYYGIDEKRGVLVTEVFKGDPADEAGIRPKDVIIEVNGTRIDETRELTRIIADIEVGDQAAIKVLRDGREKTFRVTIAKRDDGRIAIRSGGPESGTEDVIGVQVTGISPEIARRFEIQETDGVIITEVSPGSKGAKAGLRAGDVIKEINHQPIESVTAYREAIDAVDTGEALHFFIRRQNMGFQVIKVIK